MQIVQVNWLALAEIVKTRATKLNHVEPMLFALSSIHYLYEQWFVLASMVTLVMLKKNVDQVSLHENFLGNSSYILYFILMEFFLQFPKNCR